LIITWYQKKTPNTTQIYPINGKTPTDDAVNTAIQKAHTLGIKVMLKPHIDPEDGTWRAFIGQNFTDHEWNEWFYSYTEFITHYAQLNADQFCIGVEYVTASTRQQQWRSVVSSIRAVFTGPITYAANWGSEINQFTWGDALDFIGVDAYYPLTNNTQPSYQELVEGWITWSLQLKNISLLWKKPLIFTEVGYKSITGGAIMPGNFSVDGAVNGTQQMECFQSVLDTFVKEDWWQGVFWWAWLTDPQSGTLNPKDYTPQQKPAQTLLKKYYSQ